MHPGIGRSGNRCLALWRVRWCRVHDADLIVFFPSLLNSSTANVVLDFPGSILPSGTTPKKFVLYQLLGGPQGVVVADCGTTPNASPDTCIVTRAKYGTQGVELVLRVLGSLIDPRYVG